MASHYLSLGTERKLPAAAVTVPGVEGGTAEGGEAGARGVGGEDGLQLHPGPQLLLHVLQHRGLGEQESHAAWGEVAGGGGSGGEL